jgi:RNA polymerase sigma-70 factor, ECF subfamily
MAVDPQDLDLLERIRRDDPEAFERFVERWGSRIYGLGLRFCGEREDAKDVLQDTLIQAYRSLKDLEHPEALKSWLYRVASNACLMKRRKGKYEPDRELSLEELAPRPDEGPGVEIPDPASLPDEDLERDELRRRVRDAIGDLPPHYRIVIVMRDMEHLSTREVSEALSLPETAVKMRLHRARLMVRQRLESLLRQEASAGGTA